MGFFSSFSFLAPLYVAAGLAVGLPILFHMIRRTPRGRQDFSSVMFLEPSPPRVTRRSRIEHWLLLMLRALAVLLIVAAFTRPLWRQSLAANQPGLERETVVLLDTSASMRREGLWEEAIRKVSEVVDDAARNERLTLLTFADDVTPLIDSREWSELEPSERSKLLEERLAALEPTWQGSSLGQALIEAADRLEQSDAGAASRRKGRVVVISDLQAGSRWEPLQEFEWPAAVETEFHRIGETASETNAGVQIVGRPEIAEPPFARVRVTNSASSGKETFRVGWSGPFDDPTQPLNPEQTVEVYVPPGQSRVVRLPQAEGEPAAGRIVLEGDEHSFDSVTYVAWPQRRQMTIVYLGDDEASDRTGLRFFLEPLFPDTADREVSVVTQLPADTIETTERSDAGPALTIVARDLDESTLMQLRERLRSGAAVLYVCREGDDARDLYLLAEAPPASAAEADVDGYAMLRQVDFEHPLFRALDDPRYSDLSKVQIWRHRVIDPESLPRARVLAEFDSGDPALLEIPVGEGKLLTLTTTWSREDGQFATWSKFVPIMNALLEYGSGAVSFSAQLTVGAPLPDEDAAGNAREATGVRTIGGEMLPIDSEAARAATQRPGLYRLVFGDAAEASDGAGFAVNIAPEESNTAPLELTVLEAAGVRLGGDAARPDAELDRNEQLARSELESRQKLWRWLLAAALAILLLETILAARRGRTLVPADAV